MVDRKNALKVSEARLFESASERNLLERFNLANYSVVKNLFEKYELKQTKNIGHPDFMIKSNSLCCLSSNLTRKNSSKTRKKIFLLSKKDTNDKNISFNGKRFQSPNLSLVPNKNYMNSLLYSQNKGSQESFSLNNMIEINRKNNQILMRNMHLLNMDKKNRFNDMGRKNLNLNLKKMIDGRLHQIKSDCKLDKVKAKAVREFKDNFDVDICGIRVFKHKKNAVLNFPEIK